MLAIGLADSDPRRLKRFVLLCSGFSVAGLLAALRGKTRALLLLLLVEDEDVGICIKPVRGWKGKGN